MDRKPVTFANVNKKNQLHEEKHRNCVKFFQKQHFLLIIFFHWVSLHYLRKT